VAKAFFDTNVLLYLISSDTAKADTAEALVSRGGVISVQVLNEFASVAVRKLGMPYREIREVLQVVREVCMTSPLTLETHDLALEIAERYGYSVYDALTLAAATLAECDVLYSEDLQNGQRIQGKLRVTNPFVQPGA
jgi:predicted nucleic acid-binding protein